MVDRLHSVIQDKLDAGHVLIMFKGPFSQETLVDLGSFIRSRLCESKKIKRIFASFIEMAQNILRYSEEKVGKEDSSVGIGTFVLREEDRHYVLSTANLISSTGMEVLEPRLERISSYDTDQINNAYQEQRKYQKDTSEKGAGLGLLELAKRADGPLEYEFKHLPSEKILFSIVVKILK